MTVEYVLGAQYGHHKMKRQALEPDGSRYPRTAPIIGVAHQAGRVSPGSRGGIQTITRSSLNTVA